jgi:hypothetical protein
MQLVVACAFRVSKIVCSLAYVLDICNYALSTGNRPVALSMMDGASPPRLPKAVWTGEEMICCCHSKVSEPHSAKTTMCLLVWCVSQNSLYGTPATQPHHSVGLIADRRLLSVLHVYSKLYYP